jgi:hypothetical protein
MSRDDDILAGFLGDEKPISQITRRVAELLRLPGAIERWRQQCQQSFREHRLRCEEHGKWQRGRRVYLTEHSAEDGAVDSTPPEPGWTWDAERLGSPDGTKTWLANAWLPPELRADKEPFTGPLLPFSTCHTPSLADGFLVLAAVYDFEYQGPYKINPFTPDFMGAQQCYYPFASENLKGECWYQVQMDSVARLSDSDRLTLKKCLARVETYLESEWRAAEARRTATHSIDFTSVNWYGTVYNFSKGLQAESVRVLWEARENGTPDLSEKTIGDQVESANNRFRLAHVFNPTNKKTGKRERHPAWGTMIKETGKGRFALSKP